MYTHTHFYTHIYIYMYTHKSTKGRIAAPMIVEAKFLQRILSFCLISVLTSDSKAFPTNKEHIEKIMVCLCVSACVCPSVCVCVCV